MRPVSAAFREAVVQSHRLYLEVEVLKAGVVQTLADGSTALSTVTDGAVTLDATAASRGRLDLQVVDDGSLGLVPTSAGSLLAPYGNELRVRRGLIFADGSIEAPTIGVFRIDECNVDDGSDGMVLQITGQDRSVRIIDARFEDAFQVAQGTNVEAAILATILPAMPSLEWVFPGATYVTPLLNAAEGDDRWAFAQKIATACGLELYFNGDGRLVLAPPPAGAPVASFIEGPSGVLLSAGRDWRRAGAYNRCVVTGENTGEAAPVRGVATDLNPLSPTYYYGPFGQVPFFYTSQFITTNAQAAAAAATMLVSQLGTTQQVDFGVIVDPSLEPGDIAQITRQRTAIDEMHIISQVTIPLTAQREMSGTTRAVQV